MDDVVEPAVDDMAAAKGAGRRWPTRTGWRPSASLARNRRVVVHPGHAGGPGLELSKSTFSHHLRIMREAGLVTKRIQGAKGLRPSCASRTVDRPLPRPCLDSILNRRRRGPGLTPPLVSWVAIGGSGLQSAAGSERLLPWQNSWRAEDPGGIAGLRRRATSGLTDQVVSRVGWMRSTRCSPGSVVAKLARKRPSPIQSGRASTWARRGRLCAGAGLTSCFDFRHQAVCDGLMI